MMRSDSPSAGSPIMRRFSASANQPIHSKSDRARQTDRLDSQNDRTTTSALAHRLSFVLSLRPFVSVLTRGRFTMRKVRLVGSGLVLAAAAAVAIHAQQDKSKRPSPPASAKCDLAGGKSITVDYSSPRAKGRKVFGGIVPYGEVWRAGATEATTFVTTADLMVGSHHVPAGNYTLFTIPGQDKWTLIISKKTGEW